MADPVPPFQPPSHTLQLPPESGGGTPTTTRVYFYQESLARTTTSSTSYSTKVSVTFTPNAGKTYAIFWSALLDGNSTSNRLNAAIVDMVSGLTLDELQTSAANADTDTNKLSAGGVALYTAPTPATERTFAIRFSVSNAALQMGIQEARLCVLELIDGVDAWASAVAEQSTTNSTYSSAVSISWTPATAGNYLTLTSAHVRGGAAGIKARLYINNTTAASEITGFAAYTSSERQAYHGAYRHSNISGAQTAALQWGSANGFSAPILNAYIVTLRLDQFQNSFWAEDRTQHSSSSATYTDAASVTGTPEAFPHLVLACGNIDIDTDTTYTTSSATRIAVGGTGQGTVYAQQRAKSFAYRSWFQALVRTESAVSTTWSTQYARTAGTTPARTDEHVLAALQLEAAAAPVGGTVTYVGAGTAAHANYDVAANPPLPSGTQAGDLLVCFSHLRSAGSISSTWATHVQNDASTSHILVSYKLATGSDTAPVITPSGASQGQHHSSCVLAFRGVNSSAPFGTPGIPVQNAASEDLGPIPAVTATGANGVVIVFGARNDAIGTSSDPALLTGDGLNWVEAVDSASVDNKSHVVVNYAIWTGGAPTLTAKTFDVAAGTAIAVSAGVMTTINPAVTELTCVGTGAVVTGDHDDVLTPALPTGVLAGDLLIAFGYLRNAGTLSVSSGWTQRSLVDTTVNSSSFYLQTWYRFATGGDTAPTITISGGSASPQSITVAFCTAYRGVNSAQPFLSDGADSFNATAANVGPISVPPSVPNYGAVLVFGVRNATAWTSVATLSGDSLTWAEDVDATATLGGLGVSVALDHAIWSNGAPTLTAKTFVPTGGAGGPGFGKMFILNAGVTSTERNTAMSADAVATKPTTLTCSLDCIVSAPSDTNVGALAVAGHEDAMVPGLPHGIIATDTLIAVGYLRNAGVLDISAGWTEHSLTDTVANGAPIYLRTWYCIYDGSQVAPTITVSQGSASPQTLALSYIVSVRGLNQSMPFAVDGPDSFSPLQTAIGPISPPFSLPSDGAVVVIGFYHDLWSDVATLSGDGLTWVELFDSYSHTLSGLSISSVANYAKWQTTAPPLTAKTFVPSGAAASVGMGKMLVLNASAARTETVATTADCVVVSATSRVAGLDAYVVPGTVFIQTSMDGYAIPAVPTASNITFLDCVVVRLEVPDAELSALGELSAPTTSTAWLVLLTLDHPDLPSPIRVTSDGVPTVSNGNIFSPFPFQVILPDDVEGRPPQAQLRIDNTTQEIIAVLRGLTTPPKLTMQIVRSLDPNVIEYQWIGLDWSASTYDKGEITGTLTFADLSREQFPFVSFDSRWRGLWPT